MRVRSGGEATLPAAGMVDRSVAITIGLRIEVKCCWWELRDALQRVPH